MILDQSDKVIGYRRSHAIVISNPLGGVPTLTFQLQWVVELNGERTLNDGGEVTVQLAPDTPLTIYDPNTDKVLLHATDGLIQAGLYSLYLRTMGIAP